MPAKNFDLHGNVPDKATVAFLLIDVINDLEFPGGGEFLRTALPAAKKIAALKRRMKQAGIPVIYVNDNFGKWQSDFHKLVQHCLEDNVRGRPIAALLQPDEDDYFILKPKLSGFFGTTLELLLGYLQVSALVLAGFAGNMCVQFTANDAYLRDYYLFIPADCSASRTKKDNTTALKQMRVLLKADIRPSSKLRPTHLNRKTRGRRTGS